MLSVFNAAGAHPFTVFPRAAPTSQRSLIEQLEVKLDLRAKVQAWATVQGTAGGQLRQDVIGGAHLREVAFGQTKRHSREH